VVLNRKRTQRLSTLPCSSPAQLTRKHDGQATGDVALPDYGHYGRDMRHTHYQAMTEGTGEGGAGRQTVTTYTAKRLTTGPSRFRRRVRPESKTGKVKEHGKTKSLERMRHDMGDATISCRG